MDKCNKVCNPIVTSCKLKKDNNGKPVDAISYKQMVGSLMYMLATRPDLSYSICLVARYMERPTEVHLVAKKKYHKVLKRDYKPVNLIQDEGKYGSTRVGWLWLCRK